MLLLPFAPDEVIDSATLRQAGLTSHPVERLCRSGELHQLVRGWYSTRPPSDASDRHRLTLTALLRHFAGRAAASHHSRLIAAWLPVWRGDVATVHLTRVADRGSRTRPGYRVHPAIGGLSLEQTPLGPAVPIAVAVVQSGIANGPIDALMAADAALARHLVTMPDLSVAVQLFDNRSKYASDSGRPGSHSVLSAEKQREDAIRDEAYGFLWVTWAQLDRPAELLARIKAAIARVGRRG